MRSLEPLTSVGGFILFELIPLWGIARKVGKRKSVPLVDSV
jgi:hypothetical protein